MSARVRCEGISCEKKDCKLIFLLTNENELEYLVKVFTGCIVIQNITEWK